MSVSISLNRQAEPHSLLIFLIAVDPSGYRLKVSNKLGFVYYYTRIMHNYALSRFRVICLPNRKIITSNEGVCVVPHSFKRNGMPKAGILITCLTQKSFTNCFILSIFQSLKPSRSMAKLANNSSASGVKCLATSSLFGVSGL